MTNIRMPLTCTRCNKVVGMAKVSVPLYSTTTEIGWPNMRLVIADEGDLSYWQKHHSKKDCDIEVDRRRAAAAAARA